MRRDLVFLHIPKTGGTAVRNALVKALPDRRVLLDYGPQADETSPEIKALVYAGETPVVPEDFRRKVDDGRGILLVGHIRARKYWRHFHAESFVTVLRDPVERLISEYNHLARRQGLDQTIEEFAASAQPRLLSSLLRGVSPSRFGFVGFTESLDGDMARLSALIGRPLDVVRENEGTYDPALAERLADPRLRNRLRRHVAEDSKLYRHLQHTFAVRRVVRAQRLATSDDFVGRVRLTKDGRLVGFAVNRVVEALLDVEVLAGDRVVARVTADRHLAYLRTLGLARSGVGGFEVRLGRGPARWLRLGGARRLTVRIAGVGVELAGSPVALGR